MGKLSYEEKMLRYLRTVCRAGEAKQMRNGRKYYNSEDFSPSNDTSLTPLGWIFSDYSFEEDSSPTPKVNVAKSIVDTYISKISNQKVLPLFTPKKGSFITRRVVKAMQHYFNDLFYRNHVNEVITDAERYAAIFDFGWTWVDTWTKTIKPVAPWNIGIVKNEWQYHDRGSVALIQYRNFPISGLADYGIKSDFFQSFYCLLEFYYDVNKNVAKIFMDKKEVKSKKWNGTRVPLRAHYFNKPLLGFRTSSLFDDLLPLQQQIDINITKIKDATMSTPLNTHFIPEGTDIDITQLTAGSGNVIRYRPVPGATGDPIHTSTPAPVDNFFLQWHEILKQDGYEMAGVSEMSAQSTNQLGAGASGAALETMENIESARFETQLTRVIRAYVDVSFICIDSFDE